MRQNRLYPSICYYHIFSLAFGGQPDPPCTYGRNRKCRAQPLHLYLIRSDIDEKKKKEKQFFPRKCMSCIDTTVILGAGFTNVETASKICYAV